ncbi:MAG TPA: nucleoside diphosphate kinase regulator [Terriglobales bacterium]|nr:nucleoside diphosphate kinase regulator [Terriglobales bacterium]
MTTQMVVITERDMTRLQRLIDSARQQWRDQSLLDRLEGELTRAKVVSGKRVPADVVTMNSRVRVTDLDNGKESIYQIVFPRDANTSKNMISVLAPIGTALLGFRIGSKIEWETPGGIRRLRIDAIEYQPEAAGAVA